MAVAKGDSRLREACPWLPQPEGGLSAAVMAECGPDRGARFYHAALNYAQNLWREGFPARAVLLLNRAMGCALSGHEPVLQAWPIPYMAAAWILKHHRQDDFIGNPRRHWQHLATRMVEPRRELRTWRAWACWHMACVAMPHLPADALQLSRESLIEPTPEAIESALEDLGLPGEAALWQAALVLCRITS